MIRQLVTIPLALGAAIYVLGQARKPDRWLGRGFAWMMNRSHSALTDWGLGHVTIDPHATVLDVGCGGGRTVRKLAAAAGAGRVTGVDFAAGSVAQARAENAAAIRAGRVEILQAPVSQLPFPDGTFDLVTAAETHYYWPDLPGDAAEIRRVMKPGGTLIVIAEAYRGARLDAAQALAMKALRGTLLSLEGHREWLVAAGFTGVEVFEERGHGWMCVTGRKL